MTLLDLEPLFKFKEKESKIEKSQEKVCMVYVYYYKNFSSAVEEVSPQT